MNELSIQLIPWKIDQLTPSSAGNGVSLDAQIANWHPQFLVFVVFQVFPFVEKPVVVISGAWLALQEHEADGTAFRFYDAVGARPADALRPPSDSVAVQQLRAHVHRQTGTNFVATPK